MNQVKKSELWDEIRSINYFEVFGSMIREELLKESVEVLDLSYLSVVLDEWWLNRTKQSLEPNVSELYLLIRSHLKSNDLERIQSVGLATKKLAAVLMNYTFTIPDKKFARAVHEAMARVAGIVDIKYPYEEHKELSFKSEGEQRSDWGRGLGIIRPHSDDLYEARDINVMSLTCCKDISRTPTWFWLLKDVVSCLTDEELGRLALSEATFISGKNVEGPRIESKKPILRRVPSEGMGLRLDFRIDDVHGPRMRFEDQEIQAIADKMREGLKTLKPIASNPSTGTSAVLANFKILHGRSRLQAEMLYEGEESRVLFRSKGVKA